MKRSKEVEKQSGAGQGLWFTRSTFAIAFAQGGCAICTAVHPAKRKGTHSFLHEGMMFPSVRQKFLDGGGFCHRHFWMSKPIEDDAWQTGGFGMAILCDDLIRMPDSELANENGIEPNPRSALLSRRDKPPFVPGQDCMFCPDNREKEQFLAEVLEELADEKEFHKPLTMHGLCIRLGQLALQIWKDSRKRNEWFSNLRHNSAIWAELWVLGDPELKRQDQLLSDGKWTLLRNLGGWVIFIEVVPLCGRIDRRATGKKWKGT